MKLLHILFLGILISSCAQGPKSFPDKPMIGLVQNEKVRTAVSEALAQLDAPSPSPFGALTSLQSLGDFNQYTPYETGLLWMTKGLALQKLENWDGAADAYQKALPLVGNQFTTICPLLKEVVLLHGAQSDLSVCTQ